MVNNQRQGWYDKAIGIAIGEQNARPFELRLNQLKKELKLKINYCA